jgi:hypothetical protein
MALGTAIRHLRKGDWTKAHAIVQNDESTLGCWAHGIVHMMEGGPRQRPLWYRRAHRLFPRDGDPATEIAALTAAMKDTQT